MNENNCESFAYPHAIRSRRDLQNGFLDFFFFSQSDYLKCQEEFYHEIVDYSKTGKGSQRSD